MVIQSLVTHASGHPSAKETDPPPRITIVLPENPQYDAGDEPKDWELSTDPGVMHSQYIISDKPKPNAANKRARKSQYQFMMNLGAQSWNSF